MSIGLYDEALVEKIQKWIRDPNMRVLKPDEVTRLFQIKADLNNDAPLKLPLIALARNPEFEITSVNKKPMSHDGMMLRATKDKSLQIDAIPIVLGYQLDIYTRYQAEGDEYLRNFIFNLVNYPRFTITLPYHDVNIEHYGNITLLGTVTDNSDIPQRLFSDQFVRWTIRFTIEDAHLFSLPYVGNVKMSEEHELEIEESKK